MQYKIKQLIADISFEKQLSHVGSCLTMSDLIYDIHSVKGINDHFILDAGHSFLAYACYREVSGTVSARQIYDHHGTHPDRCAECGIEVSTGSLGLGGAIGLGMALSKPDEVYVATSDGALSEGIWAETLRYAQEKELTNFHVFVNCNGFGAYREIDDIQLTTWLLAYPALDIRIYNTNLEDYEIFNGQDAHYKVLNKKDYEKLKKAIHTA